MAEKSELLAEIDELVSVIFGEVDPIEPLRFNAMPFLTRNVEVKQGITATLQEVPRPNSSGRPSGAYVLTVVNRADHEPPRVHAVAVGTLVGAVACECLDPSIATNLQARSSQEWYGLDTVCGRSIAEYVAHTVGYIPQPVAG